MVRYRDILRLADLGFDKTEIAESCGCHRNTVANVLKQAKEKGIEWPLPRDTGDVQLYRMLWPEKAKREEFAEPDFAHVSKELKRKHVTISLLWQEYRDECIATSKTPYQFSTFCEHYRNWHAQTGITMHIDRKPGEILEVDWCGTQMRLIERDTGEIIPVSIFVACLAYSKLIYAEGFLSQNSEAWLVAHVHALSFLGGVPATIVPDNLKTGVSGRKKGTVTINRAYAEFAEYYNTAVIPTRVRKPRDKPAVEGSVGIVSRRVIAALRHEVFYSLADLNRALSDKVAELNAAPFAKRPQSRKDVFTSIEKDVLSPLPKEPFDVCSWVRATVQSDYHVLADRSYYSVPFEYISRKVDIRISATTVEVFFEDERIATHPRSHSDFEFVTKPEHRPENHQVWATNDVEGLFLRAQNIGVSVHMLIEGITAQCQTAPEKLGRARAFMNIAHRYGEETLRRACNHALQLADAENFTVEIIERIAADNIVSEEDEESGALLRGEGYWRGGEGNE